MGVADAWTAERLSREQRDRLAALPPLARLEVEGLGPVLFCHGTPRSDEERVTAVTPEPRLARDPRRRRGGAGRRRAHPPPVRPARDSAGWSTRGAVGRPYEREPGAYWLQLGPGVEHRRTPYDTRAAVEAFRELGYPDAERTVPGDDPDEVAAMFEAGADAPLAPDSLTGR